MAKSREYRKILKPPSHSNLKEKDIERAIDNVLKVGRDAGTGKFVAVKEAQKSKMTAVVETVKKSKVGRDAGTGMFIPVRVVESTIVRDSRTGKISGLKGKSATSDKTGTKTTRKKK